MQQKIIPAGCKMYKVVWRYINTDEKQVRYFCSRVAAHSEAEAEQKVIQLFKKPIDIHNTKEE